MARGALNGCALNALALNAQGLVWHESGAAAVDVSAVASLGHIIASDGTASTGVVAALSAGVGHRLDANTDVTVTPSAHVVVAVPVSGTAPVGEIVLQGDAMIGRAVAGKAALSAIGELDKLVATRGAVGAAFVSLQPELDLKNWSLRRSAVARTFYFSKDSRVFVVASELSAFVRPSETRQSGGSELRLGHIQKGPSDVLDWDIQLGRWLYPGDAIADAQADISDTSLTVRNIEVSIQTVKVWLAGGVDGDNGWLKIKIDTTGGRSLTVAIKVRVRS